MSTLVVESCTYNTGNAGDDAVERDLAWLARRYRRLHVQEVADRLQQLEAIDAQLIHDDGNDRGHTAMLIADGITILDHGWIQCTKRSWVGRWGAGPNTLAAKYILWASLALEDGTGITDAVLHLPPSVTRPARGPIARAGRRRRRTLYRKIITRTVAWAATVDGPIALHGDWNAEETFELLQPLHDAGFTPMTAPTHPAKDPERAIDIIWIRGCSAEQVQAIAGRSSDHRPLAATYTLEENPMPNRYPGYPGANQTALWFHGRFSASPIKPNVGVLHTTETMGLPSYEGGSKAPHYSAMPRIKVKRLDWYQHYLETESSRALVNADGGVETNTLNAYQVELIGTCDPSKRKIWTYQGDVVGRAGVDYIYWPEAPKWALDELADFMASANKRLGIKLVAPAFQAYPASGGANVRDGGPSNRVRFTFARWRSFYGWLGHEHVPENTHGDPGNIDIGYLLQAADDIFNPKPEQTRVQLLGTQLVADLAAIGAAIAKAQETVDKYDAVPEARKRVHRAVAQIDADLDAALADVTAAAADYDKIPPK